VGDKISSEIGLNNKTRAEKQARGGAKEGRSRYVASGDWTIASGDDGQSSSAQLPSRANGIHIKERESREPSKMVASLHRGSPHSTSKWRMFRKRRALTARVKRIIT
jgi:hypothetical protein